jgi:hypothetical protein
MGFVREHPVPGATGSFPFLPADFFDARALGFHETFFLLFIEHSVDDCKTGGVPVIKWAGHCPKGSKHF